MLQVLIDLLTPLWRCFLAALMACLGSGCGLMAFWPSQVQTAQQKQDQNSVQQQGQVNNQTNAGAGDDRPTEPSTTKPAA